jgi:hypothetical protein
MTVLSFSLAPVSFAAESENTLTGFFKRLFNYPAKATKETAGMTANTLQNTGEKIVAKTGENTAAVVTGDIAKTGNLAVDPVVGTLETTGQTVSETVQIPAKAAEEEHPQ